ncbi:DoxX family protein [Corynebacterium anserum]|uniref:DoxX family membrane protein n=1 Tax=Corynebacterium anserum TaxID=2684406 RepID=A0A7G7YLG7_9CORY|nr:DoxX family protein [Corynebacterium anserum]MBC2682560.1 DoxX family membrane protein [Corynebacterium anserum]QNH95337.1 DoxX family membrane protein [Corynebacterium anserum]
MTFIKDIFLLLARVILGVVLLAHGWQKLHEWTVEGTARNFAGMGVPMPEQAAQFTTYFEIAGGILLIIGLLVRIVGPVLAVQMAGAAWFVHIDSGIFATNGGWELVGVIGAGGLALSAAGAGRISLDHLFSAPFRRHSAKKKAAVQEHSATSNDADFVSPAGDARPTPTPAPGVGSAGSAAGMGAANSGAANHHTPLQGGFVAKDDYSEARTEQLNLNADEGGAARVHPQRAPQIDSDAPTTQWPHHS